MFKLLSLTFFVLLLFLLAVPLLASNDFSYEYEVLKGQIDSKVDNNNIMLTIAQEVNYNFKNYYVNLFHLNLGNGTDIIKSYSAKNLLNVDSFNYFVKYFTSGYENGTIAYQVQFQRDSSVLSSSITKQCLFWGCNKLVINNLSLIDLKGMKIKDIILDIFYARTLFSVDKRSGVGKAKFILKVVTEDNKRSGVDEKRERVPVTALTIKKEEDVLRKRNKEYIKGNAVVGLNSFPNTAVTITIDFDNLIYFQVFSNGISTYKSLLKNIYNTNLQMYHDEKNQIIYTLHNFNGNIVVTQIDYTNYKTKGITINQMQTPFPAFMNVGIGFDGRNTVYALCFKDVPEAQFIIIAFDIQNQMVSKFIQVKLPSNSFNSFNNNYYYDSQKNIFYVTLKVTKDCPDRSIVGINAIDGSITTISQIPRSTLLHIQPNPYVNYGEGTVINSFSLGYERLNSTNLLIVI
ncbi:hypothetical protein ABK040_007651 [Willaertia magna]